MTPKRKKTSKHDERENEQPLVIDIDTAIRILETTPHERAELDEETKRYVKEILDRIDSEEIPEDGITDASVNLDKYRYDPNFKD